MEEVTDVADGQAGAGADFFVGKAVMEFEADQFAAAVVERLNAQTHQADPLHSGDLSGRITAMVGYPDLGESAACGYRHQQGHLCLQYRHLRREFLRGKVRADWSGGPMNEWIDGKGNLYRYKGNGVREADAGLVQG